MAAAPRYTAGILAARRHCRACCSSDYLGGKVLNCEHIETSPASRRHPGDTWAPSPAAGHRPGSGQKWRGRVVRREAAPAWRHTATSEREHCISAPARVATLEIPGEAEFVGKGRSHCDSRRLSCFMGGGIVMGGATRGTTRRSPDPVRVAGHRHPPPRTLRACGTLQGRARGHAESSPLERAVRASAGRTACRRVAVEDSDPGRAPLPGSGSSSMSASPQTAFLGDLVPLTAGGHS